MEVSTTLAGGFPTELQGLGIRIRQSWLFPDDDSPRFDPTEPVRQNVLG